MIDPAMFESLWKDVPVGSSLKLGLKRMPSPEEASHHVTSRGFAVVASGVVGTCLRMFIASKADESVVFLAELVFDSSSHLLSATFKCTQRSKLAAFLQELNITRIDDDHVNNKVGE